MFLPTQLREAGLTVTAQDDTEEYKQTERDPWMFYRVGKEGKILVTSDLKFRKSFPHMAAISFGRTIVLTFTGKTYNSDIRGAAFIRALPEIEKAITAHLRKRLNFIGVISRNGEFSIKEKRPDPLRVTAHRLDWESYERVCLEEGMLPFGPTRPS